MRNRWGRSDRAGECPLDQQLAAEFRALQRAGIRLEIRWTDEELLPRQLALGLSQDALADMLAVTQASACRAGKRGARRIPAGINDELVDLEDPC